MHLDIEGSAGRPLPARPNFLAIVAPVLAFFFGPLGIVVGVVARRQIARTGEDGWALATAGVILGIVLTVLSLAAVVVIAVLASIAA